MIVWDFNVIVALVLTVGLGIVLGCWVFYTLNRGRRLVLSDLEFFRQCSFCSYLYFDYFKKKPANCPRCGSYQE